jgi:hypothetical protein
MDGVDQRGSLNSRRQHRPRVVRSQRAGFQRHLAQEAQGGLEFGINCRGLEIVEDLFRERFIEGDRRDRGVGIRSKHALVEPRHEGSKQLAFADGPLGRTPHDCLGVDGVRLAEEGLPVCEGAHDVRRSKARHDSDHRVEQAVRQALAAFHDFQSHARPTASSAAFKRCPAAPTAAATITSKSWSSL